MKNILYERSVGKIKWILRIMKLTVFALFVCMSTAFATGSYSQVKRVTVVSNHTTMGKVINEIEKQTDYLFVYNVKEVNLNRNVRINARNETVAEVLHQMFEGTNIGYAMEGKNIMLRKASEYADSPDIEQQEHKNKVSGVVKDASGEPIIGANVSIKGTSIGTITDINGKFVLEVSDNRGTLITSYVGYAKQEILIKDKHYFAITLRENPNELNEVVVLGYGSQLRRSVTGAISSVRGKDIEAPNAISADNLLQGKVAGLSISQNSAQPGTSMSVNIRGQLSPNGSNSPLYVIDGVVISSESNKAAKVGPLLGTSNRDGSDRSPLATLNPNDIASIDVLKDASATAIYGSQAANGVIIITTKKGQTGKPTVTYSGSFSVQGLKSYYHMLNAWDYMKMANLGMKEQWLYTNRYAPYGTTEAPTSGWTVLYTDAQIAAQKDTYDHFAEITRTGWIENHNVSLTAGSENFKVYASFNYFDQKSLLKTTDLERFSGRINMEAIFNRWLKLNLSSMYTYLDADNPSSGHWRANANEANQTNSALYFSPRLPLKDEYGNLTSPENLLTANPLAWSYMKDKTTTKRLFFAPNLEIKMLPYLKANVQLSVDKTDENRDMFSPTKSKLPQQTENNFGGYSNAYNNNYGMEEYVTFDKQFGDHYFNAVLGTGYYVTSGNNYSVTVYNFPSDALENNYLELSSDVEHTEYSSDRWKRNKLSYFGRFNYTFKDRYIFGTTLRHDGSSVFADNHKWGWFPGVSTAWIISGEKFMENLKAINYLKLRAGYGTTGNESILTSGNYSLTTYGMATGAFFYYGGTYNKGIVEKQKGNKNLKWETDYSFDTGIDFSLLNDRLSGSIDYYVRTAKDLLDFAQLPTTDMVATMAKNIGKTRSTGYEVALKGILVNHKNWGWNAYVNFSHNRSYWVERNPEVSLASWIKGKDDLTSVYGWRTKGIFHSLQEVQEWQSKGNVLQPNAYPGNKRYVDVNGDGILDDKDIVRFGNTDPKLRFGLGTSLRYKNCQLDIDTYGALGMLRWDQWIYRGLCDSKINTSKHVYDVWTSFNTSGWYPGIAADVAGNNNKSGSDDFTLKKVNYFRIKNLKLTYTIPHDWLRSTKLASNANIYFDLQNTAIFTNYEGLDPEMEQNYAAFPIPYTLVFGANITF